MTQILTWFVMAYGFTNIMVYGSIFRGMRDTIKKIGDSDVPIFSGIFNFISGILSCMMCCSSWVGFFLGFFLFSPSHILFETHPYISWFFDGLLASGAVWGINGIVEWFEENRPSKR